jgi:hypothetical protein
MLCLHTLMKFRQNAPRRANRLIEIERYFSNMYILHIGHPPRTKHPHALTAGGIHILPRTEYWRRNQVLVTVAYAPR